MSTKIYDAYEWMLDVPSAFQFLQKMRVRVQKQASTSIGNYNYPKQMPQYKLVEEIQKSIRSGMWDPLNISSSAVVYMYKGRVFIQFFGLDRSWDRKLNRTKHLIDYHYQNQTDMPSGVTDKQWDDRRKTWEGIFKGSGTPSQAGLTFDFISDAHSSIYRVVAPIYDRMRALKQKEQQGA